MIKLFIATVIGSLLTYGAMSYQGKSDWHHEKASVVLFDPGGNPFQYAQAFAEMRVKGKKLRIEGPCISACTTFFKLIEPENVCASKHASFGFHGASNSRGEYLRDITDFLINTYYPDHIIKQLDQVWDRTKQVVDPKNLDIIWLNRDEVQVQHCENMGL